MKDSMKYCSRCGRSEDEVQFGSNGGGQLRSSCKNCERDRDRRRRGHVPSRERVRPAPEPRQAKAPAQLVAEHRRDVELRILREEKEHLIKELMYANERAEVLAAISGVGAAEPTPLKRREKTSGLREATAVVMASDWHVEEPVDPEKVNGLNEYNLDIADRRITRFTDGVLWLVEKDRSLMTIRDLVLWLGGDLFSGYIHEDLMESNQLSPVESILWLQARLRRTIDTLLDRGKFEKLIIPCTYGNHGRCHDDQTELLTRSGWCTYDQLSVGDEVATFDMHNGATVWQPLQEVYVAEYDGPMVYVNTKVADFAVTPRHRMVVHDEHTGEYEIRHMEDIVEAGTLGARSFPKCTMGHEIEFAGVSDDELRILGWLMTDGSYSEQQGHKSMAIYQSKPAGIAELSGLLDRAKVDFSVYRRLREPPVIKGVQCKTAREEVTFRFRQASVNRFLALLPDKALIPDWMRSLSRRQFNVWLDALLLGDGSVDEHERVLYGRREFLSQVQELAVVNGIGARLREDGRGDFVLSLPKSQHSFINDFEKSVQVKNYKGTIWCGTVANGTLVTRRNGIPLVSGNTTKKMRVQTGAENSYEWMMYKMLAMQYQNEKRIEFTVPKSALVYMDIYDFTLRFAHGDQLKYEGGIGGLTIPLNKAIHSWNVGRYADITCIGHWHQYMSGEHSVVNGSLIGTSPFSIRIKAPHEPPRQAYFLLDAKHGKTVSAPIIVGEKGPNELYS